MARKVRALQVFSLRDIKGILVRTCSDPASRIVWGAKIRSILAINEFSEFF